MAHPTRPYVGLNADLVPLGRTGGANLQLHAGYVDAVLSAGALPLIVPPLTQEAELLAYVNQVTGFVFTGGLDLDPRRVGIPTHPAVRAMPERRDDSDRLLSKHVLARKLPILAVGVGVQQLTVALGGTLYLHLPEDLPRSLPHRDPGGGAHRHLVLLEPGTRLDEIYGGGELRVNSAHHQAVRQPPAGFRIAARAPDGVVEAIESANPDWFCVGVQWHPECETASALDAQLFESFVQACVRPAPARAAA